MSVQMFRSLLSVALSLQILDRCFLSLLEPLSAELMPKMLALAPWGVCCVAESVIVPEARILVLRILVLPPEASLLGDDGGASRV